jgi:cold shock CspA family protein
MKPQLIGEISGAVLRFALHEFMSQIELCKNYRVHISEIQSEKVTMQGNDLSVSFDAEAGAENLRKEWARLERIDHQALNVSHDCDLIETPDGRVRIIREDV